MTLSRLSREDAIKQAGSMEVSDRLDSAVYALKKLLEVHCGKKKWEYLVYKAHDEEKATIVFNVSKKLGLFDGTSIGKAINDSLKKAQLASRSPDLIKLADQQYIEVWQDENSTDIVIYDSLKSEHLFTLLLAYAFRIKPPTPVNNPLPLTSAVNEQKAVAPTVVPSTLTLPLASPANDAPSEISNDNLAIAPPPPTTETSEIKPVPLLNEAAPHISDEPSVQLVETVLQQIASGNAPEQRQSSGTMSEEVPEQRQRRGAVSSNYLSFFFSSGERKNSDITVGEELPNAYFEGRERENAVVNDDKTALLHNSSLKRHL